MAAAGILPTGWRQQRQAAACAFASPPPWRASPWSHLVTDDIRGTRVAASYCAGRRRHTSRSRTRCTGARPWGCAACTLGTSSVPPACGESAASACSRRRDPSRPPRTFPLWHLPRLSSRSALLHLPRLSSRSPLLHFQSHQAEREPTAAAPWPRVRASKTAVGGAASCAQAPAAPSGRRARGPARRASPYIIRKAVPTTNLQPALERRGRRDYRSAPSSPPPNQLFRRCGGLRTQTL